MEQRNNEIHDNGGFEKNENHTGSQPDYTTTEPRAAPAVPQTELTSEPKTEVDAIHSQSL